MARRPHRPSRTARLAPGRAAPVGHPVVRRRPLAPRRVRSRWARRRAALTARPRSHAADRGPLGSGRGAHPAHVSLRVPARVGPTRNPPAVVGGERAFARPLAMERLPHDRDAADRRRCLGRCPPGLPLLAERVRSGAAAPLRHAHARHLLGAAVRPRRLPRPEPRPRRRRPDRRGGRAPGSGTPRPHRGVRSGTTRPARAARAVEGPRTRLRLARRWARRRRAGGGPRPLGRPRRGGQRRPRPRRPLEPRRDDRGARHRDGGGGTGGGATRRLPDGPSSIVRRRDLEQPRRERLRPARPRRGHRLRRDGARSTRNRSSLPDLRAPGHGLCGPLRVAVDACRSGGRRRRPATRGGRRALPRRRSRAPAAHRRAPADAGRARGRCRPRAALHHEGAPRHARSAPHRRRDPRHADLGRVERGLLRPRRASPRSSSWRSRRCSRGC